LPTATDLTPARHNRPAALLKVVPVFLLLVTAVFLIGALLSYPVYQGLTLLRAIGFHKALHYSIVLTGLSLGLWYLHATGSLAALFGQGAGGSARLKALVTGYAAGLAILLLVELSLALLGMRVADPDLGAGPGAILFAVVKALLTGITVGLLEETLYRGAIYTGLARHANAVSALILSSLFYGAVHFIDMPELPAGTAVTWSTGFVLLAGAFRQYSDPFIYDALITLCILGVFFGLLRRHTGNLLICIGAHAGVVTVNKIFSYTTEYRPGTGYAWLVNAYDHQTGILASAWLCLACVVYCALAQTGRSSRPDAK
jgi:membrane protease YdiL (CAAX protease family)